MSPRIISSMTLSTVILPPLAHKRCLVKSENRFESPAYNTICNKRLWYNTVAHFSYVTLISSGICFVHVTSCEWKQFTCHMGWDETCTKYIWRVFPYVVPSFRISQEGGRRVFAKCCCGMEMVSVQMWLDFDFPALLKWVKWLRPPNRNVLPPSA